MDEQEKVLLNSIESVDVLNDEELKNLLEEMKETEDKKYTDEDMLAVIEELSVEVEVDTENVQNLKLDKKEFQRALSDMSYICGQISALKSVGCTTSMAFDFVCAKEGLAYQNIME